jgi:hypothetical protein
MITHRDGRITKIRHETRANAARTISDSLPKAELTSGRRTGRRVRLIAGLGTPTCRPSTTCARVNCIGPPTVESRNADQCNRMSLDDFAAVGIHEYQRVRLKLPQESVMSVYLRGRRENPPFVWLEFGYDVRRLSA